MGEVRDEFAPERQNDLFLVAVGWCVRVEENERKIAKSTTNKKGDVSDEKTESKTHAVQSKSKSTGTSPYKAKALVYIFSHAGATRKHQNIESQSQPKQNRRREMSMLMNEGLRNAITRGDVQAVDRVLQSGVSSDFDIADFNIDDDDDDYDDDDNWRGNKSLLYIAAEVRGYVLC